MTSQHTMDAACDVDGAIRVKSGATSTNYGLRKKIHRKFYCGSKYLAFLLVFLSLLKEATSESTLLLQNGTETSTSEGLPEIFREGKAGRSDPTDPTATGPPLPQESIGDNNETKEAIGSLIFITTTVSLCIVAFFAFIGGAYCWYKHTGISAAARRVFYRSSDSSVLIRNAYQPMGDERAHETPGNGHVAMNNNLARLAEKTDYPAYGVTGPNPLHYAPNRPPIDSNLNRHAEVYHYQQQKQKLKALSSASSESSARSRPSTSETLNDPTTETNDDDEENSDGEYTVYECPGLASTTDGPLEIHNPLFADSETSFTSYGSSPLGGDIISSYYAPSIGNRG